MSSKNINTLGLCVVEMGFNGIDVGPKSIDGARGYHPETPYKEGQNPLNIYSAQ